MVKTNTIKFTAICILFLLIGNSLFGQRWKLRRYEVGAGIGATQVFGDIGGTIDEKNWFGLKDIQFSETNLAIPLYVRYKLDPLYSLKVNTILAFGRGDDSDSRNDRGREYKTMLFEFSVQGEYYFISEEKRYKSAAVFNKRGMINNYSSFGSYLFLGVGGVYSHANVTYTTFDQPAVDDLKENNIGVVFPIGLGLKYIIDDRWLIDAELGYRISLTDYIDGITQLDSSKFNDVYYFLTLKVGYRLETTRRGLPTFLDSEYRRANRSSNSARQPRSARRAMQ